LNTLYYTEFNALCSFPAPNGMTGKLRIMN